MTGDFYGVLPHAPPGTLSLDPFIGYFISNFTNNFPMQHGRQVACRMHSIRENKKNGSEEKIFLLRRFFVFILPAEVLAPLRFMRKRLVGERKVTSQKGVQRIRSSGAGVQGPRRLLRSPPGKSKTRRSVISAFHYFTQSSRQGAPHGFRRASNRT